MKHIKCTWANYLNKQPTQSSLLQVPHINHPTSVSKDKSSLKAMPYKPRVIMEEHKHGK